MSINDCLASRKTLIFSSVALLMVIKPNTINFIMKKLMRAAYVDMLGNCQFDVLDAPFTQEYITPI